MRYLRLTSQINGFHVGLDVHDVSGNIIVSAGTKITNKVLRRLKQNSIHGVYVDDRWSAGIKPVQAISNTAIQYTINAITSNNLDDVEGCARVIVDSLQNSPSMSQDMEALQSYDSCTFMHCFNVAINSVTLGIGMHLSNEDLFCLAEGALLHDIGKQFVSDTILKSHRKLTPDERSVVERHPELGANFLIEKGIKDERILDIVLHHHERPDGKGYPDKLSGDKISVPAAIVHICDCYDAITSKRTYKEIFDPSVAVRILKDGYDTEFDGKILQEFLKYVPIYKIGTTLKTLSGGTCVVEKNSRGDMLHPIVRLSDGTVINSAESNLDFM